MKKCRVFLQCLSPTWGDPSAGLKNPSVSQNSTCATPPPSPPRVLDHLPEETSGRSGAGCCGPVGGIWSAYIRGKVPVSTACPEAAWRGETTDRECCAPEVRPAGDSGAALCIWLTDTGAGRGGEHWEWAEHRATLQVPPAGSLGCLWEPAERIGNLPQGPGWDGIGELTWRRCNTCKYTLHRGAFF